MFTICAVLFFLFGMVAIGFGANLSLHQKVRDSLRGWEVKVARNDDLLEIREVVEEMKAEGVDRSDLLEMREMVKKAESEKKGITIFDERGDNHGN